MGRPIVYCADCGRSLPESEFDQGRAHMLDNRPFCAVCRPPPARTEPDPAPALRPGSTVRMPAAHKTARIPTARPPAHGKLRAGLAAGGGALLVIVLVAAALGGRSAPPAPEPPPPPPPPPPIVKNEAAERRREEEAARVEAAKLDGFLAQIRKLMAAEDLARRRPEIEAMLKSALETAGGRRGEVAALKAEVDKRLAAADLRAALAGHWPLDATLGTGAADASGNSLMGRLEKGPAWVKGQIGGGLQFDGADDYVELPNSPILDKLQAGSYSLSAWHRPDRIPPGKDKANDAAAGILMKEGHNLGLHYSNSGRFVMSHWLAGNKGAGATGSSRPPGRFYHVAGVVDRDKGETRLYVDAKHEKTTTFPAGAAGREYGAAKWRIGTAKAGAKEYSWPAQGIVDDVRIYSRAITEAEVRFLFEEGSAGRAP